jgi:hypothetical protein
MRSVFLFYKINLIFKNNSVFVYGSAVTRVCGVGFEALTF